MSKEVKMSLHSGGDWCHWCGDRVPDTVDILHAHSGLYCRVCKDCLEKALDVVEKEVIGPCAHCGSNNITHEIYYGDGRPHKNTFHCSECCVSMHWEGGEEEAIRVFNRRAGEYVYKCPHCDYTLTRAEMSASQNCSCRHCGTIKIYDFKKEYNHER